ncbi:MAG: SDR family oxidoreductase [Acidimicrobiales bacterium]|jgi:NAD(P)-dependent dehydrogenase (short-subunit alcohol dehydrogenase family)|nr:SDR family oxidoreductase [Acidimicrobiales bacterium]
MDQDRVAVITGGGTGVGAAAAVALNQRGWNTVICGRRLEPLETVSAMLDDRNRAVVADVSNPSSVDQLFAETVESFGRVDLLFNNAGIGAPPIPIEDVPVEMWNEVVDINLTASWLCSRAAFRQMKLQAPTGGRIINNGSVSAQTPRPFSTPYTATKHAVTGLTKALSLEGRPFGITVGQIDIGNAATPLTAQMSAGVLQPNGETMPEATMSVENVGEAVALMAELPPDANILQMTIMANEMPFVGRG